MQLSILEIKKLDKELQLLNYIRLCKRIFLLLELLGISDKIKLELKPMHIIN